MSTPAWVKVKNVTKGIILAERGEWARSIRERMVGLLGRSHLPEGNALIIEPCTSIHTFFMKFPIDVIFADKNGKVITFISEMNPFRMSWIYPRAHYCVELPAGILRRSCTEQGDMLALDPF